MFGVYRNPDLSDIFDYLLTPMAKVQSDDKKASFLFVGDVNAHHEEWLVSSTTAVHGRAALDFVSSSGCEQMVTEPTHIHGEVPDLVLTDVHDLVEVRGGLPVVTSDPSAIFIDDGNLFFT